MVPPPPVGLRHLQDLRAAGFTLVPLRGKSPCCKPGCPSPHKNCGASWQDTKQARWKVEELAAGGNVGVILSATDLVLDVDPQHFSPPDDRPVFRLTGIVAELGIPNTYVVRSGNGGIHIYYHKPAEILIRKSLPEYPGIDFRAGPGMQMVAAGSIHPDTLREYEVVRGSPGTIPIAPQSLLALIRRTEVPFSDIEGLKEYRADEATKKKYAAWLLEAAPVSGSFIVACRGRDLGLPPGATLDLLLDVWNPRRIAPKSPQEMREKVVHAYRYANGPVGALHPEAPGKPQFSPLPHPPPSSSPPPRIQVKEGGGRDGNREDGGKEDLMWDLTEGGGIKRSFQNLLNHLRIPSSGLCNVFGFNEFLGRVEFTNPAPWHRGSLPGGAGAAGGGRAVSDDDVKLLKGYLATRLGFEMPVCDIEAAIVNVAYYRRFHPVREYLEGLVWDGKERLDFWLRDYLGALDGGRPDYLRAVSRKVLCAAVRRVYEPGCEFHHVLVLEGDQDLGKSQTCKILGGQWASDMPVDPHCRDTVDNMLGRWIIEMAEMDVLRKTDEDALKAFITRPTDRVRLAYGRRTGEYPRQSIFIATKNPGPDGTYLKDKTGNRRWWPVRCSPPINPDTGLAQVDFKGLKAARNQLFAEAVRVAMTAPGEKLYMDTGELKKQAKDTAAQRHAQHEWIEAVARWSEAQTDARDFATGRDVYIEALGGVDTKFDRRAALAIAECMREVGWETCVSLRKDQGNRVVRGYRRVLAVPAIPLRPREPEKESLDILGDLW